MGFLGGSLTSRQIHDVCLANGVRVFCGGTLETAIGRAANLALATRFKPEHARTRSPSYRAFLDGLIAHSELNAVMAQATYSASR